MTLRRVRKLEFQRASRLRLFMDWSYSVKQRISYRSLLKASSGRPRSRTNGTLVMILTAPTPRSFPASGGLSGHRPGRIFVHWRQSRVTHVVFRQIMTQSPIRIQMAFSSEAPRQRSGQWNGRISVLLFQTPVHDSVESSGGASILPGDLRLREPHP